MLCDMSEEMSKIVKAGSASASSRYFIPGVSVASGESITASSKVKEDAYTYLKHYADEYYKASNKKVNIKDDGSHYNSDDGLYYYHYSVKNPSFVHYHSTGQFVDIKQPGNYKKYIIIGVVSIPVLIGISVIAKKLRKRRK